MTKIYVALTLIVLFVNSSYSQQVDKEKTVGNWKIKSFDTIDFIRSSPGYMNGDEAQRNEIDKMVDLMLDNTYYHFLDKENLTYTDVQGDKITKRKAVYNINDEGYLTIKELDRPYTRQAMIVLLTEDELIFTPVVNNKVGQGKMEFEKVKPL